MSLVSLAPVLTPHGRLTVERDEDAPALDAELASSSPRRRPTFVLSDSYANRNGWRGVRLWPATGV